MIDKLQSWIERVPWYVFSGIVFYFLVKVYLNAENGYMVIVSVIGTACFTYLAVHKLFIGGKNRVRIIEEL